MFFKAEHFVRNLRDNKRFCPCRTKCLCFAYPHVPLRVSRLTLRVCFYTFWALRFLFLHNSRAESPKALSSGRRLRSAPSEAIPHYFRTVRAKALNTATFGKPNRRFGLLKRHFTKIKRRVALPTRRFNLSKIQQNRSLLQSAELIPNQLY